MLIYSRVSADEIAIFVSMGLRRITSRVCIDSGTLQDVCKFNSSHHTFLARLLAFRTPLTDSNPGGGFLGLLPSSSTSFGGCSLETGMAP